jgi:hypothetical protein
VQRGFYRARKGAEPDVAKPRYCVEVKGLSGTEKNVGVTSNEYRCIKHHISGGLPGYRMAIVTSALQSSPHLLIAFYDPARRAWVDEITKNPLRIDIKEQMAAMISVN